METNWNESLEPLLKLYGKRKHPLDYQNRYQLIVLIILSSQVADREINKLAPAFFEAFPTLNSLAKVKPEDLFPYVHKVMNFGNKSERLVKFAQLVGNDAVIPETMDKLCLLPGIGRKSANIVIRESGGEAEGVIVDQHVVRVAPRIGLASGTQPEKIEKQIMGIVPQKRWNETGMALSFLGREICRPTHPKCTECVLNKVCNYYIESLN